MPKICYRTDTGAILCRGPDADRCSEALSDVVATATVRPFFDGEKWDWERLIDPDPEHDAYRLALTEARRHLDTEGDNAEG